ncbi:MAG: hypothetical protein CL945_11630 [Dinoroseobacter sp.]|nr:hypothetical protein [Dinoroseobacter sp.]MAX72125.1 hypothetical protein [Nioella sp.]
MIAQLASAVVRAILVVIVISTPSLLLPGATPESAQVVALVALFCAFFTFSEYASTYPGLIEFRDAPPFNRVRAVSLFITLFALSIAATGAEAPQTLALIVNATGLVVAHAIDFPYSPINLLGTLLQDDISPAELTRLRTMGGLSFLIGLVTLSIFAVLMRVHGWPNRKAKFNVWVNLPTFDPTVGGDVVVRLTRDSRINIILGFVLPFLMPILASLGIRQLGLSVSTSPQTLVWVVTLWSFLPVSLFMRGMAMARVAAMVTARRRYLTRQMDMQGGLQPV